MLRSRCVPALVVSAVLAAATAGHADDAAPLKGAAAWQKLVGNTVVATTKAGATYTDFYQPDGTVRHQDSDGATSGRWSLDGDAVCFDYPDDDDRFCVTPTVTGSAGSFADRDGGPEDAFAILQGNAKGL